MGQGPEKRIRIMAEKEELFINGLEIKNYELNSSIGLGENAMSFDCPDYVLIERKNSDKIILDIGEEDADILSQITRIDTDKYIGKKIKVLISIVGPASRG